MDGEKDIQRRTDEQTDSLYLKIDGETEEYRGKLDELIISIILKKCKTKVQTRPVTIETRE